MGKHITQRTIRALTPPSKGNKVIWDDEVVGLGVRITASGAVSFVLRYVINARERRLTIGRYPDLSASAAREEATRLRGALVHGHDPLAERQARRMAPTMYDLAADYLSKHAEKYKRSTSVQADKSMWSNIILPRLGPLKVHAVSRLDIGNLHHSLGDKPYRANRVLALLSKAFSLAIHWRWCIENPVKGIERYKEHGRERWLSPSELTRLMAVLGGQSHQRAANAVRLLILTGARRGEVLSATWDQFDLERGVWTKPSHHTKQKETQHVPLSEAALGLLSGMKPEASSRFVFPGRSPDEPLKDIKRFWVAVCRQAKIEGARIHDLRHSYASNLVSQGVSLHIVGSLLGHTQPRTTFRYSHVADGALREATDRFAGMLDEASKGEAGEVVPLREHRERAR